MIKKSLLKIEAFFDSVKHEQKSSSRNEHEKVFFRIPKNMFMEFL